VGPGIKIVAGVNDKRILMAVFAFELINQCFLAGKPSRLIGTSAAGFNVAQQVAAVNNA